MSTGFLFLALSVTFTVAIGVAHETWRNRRRSNVIDFELEKSQRRHPSNVTALEPRRRAGAHVTVLEVRR